MTQKTIATIASALLMALFLGGCAQPASGYAMTLEARDTRAYQEEDKYADSPLRANVAVGEIGGGRVTDPLWASDIGNAEFHQALEQSLVWAKLHNREGRYLLRATLLEVDRPLVGFSLTVEAEVRYVLTELDGGREVFAETIRASYTAEVADAFVATERLKLANEGAARENIKRLIARLYELKLADIALAD